MELFFSHFLGLGDSTVKPFLLGNPVLGKLSVVSTDFEVTWCSKIWGRRMIVYIGLIAILFYYFSLLFSLDRLLYLQQLFSCFEVDQ